MLSNTCRAVTTCREVVRDAAGNELSCEYDDRGNVISMTNLRGHTTRYKYNEHGESLSQLVRRQKAGETLRIAYQGLECLGSPAQRRERAASSP